MTKPTVHRRDGVLVQSGPEEGVILWTEKIQRLHRRVGFSFWEGTRLWCPCQKRDQPDCISGSHDMTCSPYTWKVPCGGQEYQKTFQGLDTMVSGGGEVHGLASRRRGYELGPPQRLKKGYRDSLHGNRNMGIDAVTSR